MTGLGDDKPAELVVTSLVRARFCELVGYEAGMKEQGMELFLLGLLSFLDALVDRSLEEALGEVYVSDDIEFRNRCAAARFGPLGFEPLSEDEEMGMAALERWKSSTTLKM